MTLWNCPFDRIDIPQTPFEMFPKEKNSIKCLFIVLANLRLRPFEGIFTVFPRNLMFWFAEIFVLTTPNNLFLPSTLCAQKTLVGSLRKIYCVEGSHFCSHAVSLVLITSTLFIKSVSRHHHSKGIIFPFIFKCPRRKWSSRASRCATQINYKCREKNWFLLKSHKS